jgi:hypothetical protein
MARVEAVNRRRDSRDATTGLAIRGEDTARKRALLLRSALHADMVVVSSFI